MWVKQGINAWMTAAGIEEGRLLRRIRKGGHIGESLSDWAVWSVVMESAREIGIERFGAHDLRRTCAKLCRKAGGDLEQIKFLLGHSSIQTTERYLGSEQEIAVAVNDAWDCKTRLRCGSEEKVDTVEWRLLKCSPPEDSVQCSFKRLRSTTLLQNTAPIGPCCFQFGIVGRCRYTPSVI